MKVDLDKWKVAVQYGKTLCEVLAGQRDDLLSVYPDNSDQYKMQYVFDNLDEDILYNDVLHGEMQSILDDWLVEDITPTQAKTALLELLADYYDFGC
jgi:hypothetical protein